MSEKVEIWFVDGPGAASNNSGLKRCIALRIDDVVKDVVTLRLDSDPSRERLAKRWATSFGLQRSLLDEKLTKATLIATSEGQNAADTTANTKPDDDGSRQSQADRLVELVQEAELFHASGEDGEAYATISVGEHLETHAVNRRGFRRWLAGRFWQEYAKAPSGQAILDALAVIASRGIFDGPELPVAVRVADCEGEIYLDLADLEWRAVRVGPTGWSVVNDPPVRFIRPRGMRSIPTPTSGGNIQELRQFINTPSDNDWALVLSWLVAALRPTGPYPILVLHGEQGSAKSTACRIARALIDPNEAPLRSEPRDPRDLMIAASNAWVLAFDNLSHLSPALSDGLCRLATGGGFATRQLFSDGDEKIFNAMRPTLLNGISELGTRGDLLDRAVVLTLPPITAGSRRTEGDLWRSFEEARPRILGALLDAVVHALKVVPNVHLTSKPRMADFAMWSVAAEPALGLRPGLFLESYGANREAANETVIEASAVGGAVFTFAEERQLWEGTAAQLLTQLETDPYTDDRTRKRRDWPRTPRGLSGGLRRIAPQLRASGIEVTFGRDPDRSRRRTVRIERSCIQPSTPSEPSDNSTNDPENAVLGRTVGTGPTVRDDQQPSDGITDIGPETPVADGSDGSDGHTSLHSGSEFESDPAYHFDEAQLQQLDEEASA